MSNETRAIAITKAFVHAVVGGIQALRSRADEVSKDAQATGDDGVGRILRNRIEVDRQDADLMAGWVKRYAPEAGVNPNDFDI